jgi:hypothetical protein
MMTTNPNRQGSFHRVQSVLVSCFLVRVGMDCSTDVRITPNVDSLVQKMNMLKKDKIT